METLKSPDEKLSEAQLTIISISSSKHLVNINWWALDPAFPSSRASIWWEAGLEYNIVPRCGGTETCPLTSQFWFSLEAGLLIMETACTVPLDGQETEA